MEIGENMSDRRQGASDGAHRDLAGLVEADRAAGGDARRELAGCGARTRRDEKLQYVPRKGEPHQGGAGGESPGDALGEIDAQIHCAMLSGRRPPLMVSCWYARNH